jgi:hypothetical protein
LPVYVSCLFSFAAVNILSLFCTVSVYIMIYLGVFLLWVWHLMFSKLPAPRWSSLSWGWGSCLL